MNNKPALFDEAGQVRSHVLQLLDHGAIASTAPLTFPGITPRPLPTVLHYSASTLKHWQWLLHTLEEVDFERLSTTSGYFDDDSRFDVMYHHEGMSEVYYLSNFALHRLPHPIEHDEDFGGASISLNNDTKPGFWIFHYYFIPPVRFSDQAIASSNYFPDKNLLLNFWFAPAPLPADFFIKGMPLAEIVRENLTLAGEETIDDFRHVNFTFNVEGYASWIDGLPQEATSRDAEANFLRSRGTLTFSVVQLGIVGIGDKPYWIYSGSEKITK